MALFKGVRYSKGAEHPTAPYIRVPYSIEYSIEKRYNEGN
jgi:hypothetical protein